MSSDVLRLNNVTLAWGNQTILKEISGGFKRGSFTAIVGPNGAGKSTLIKALTGQLAPKSGEILLAPEFKRNIALLPQQSELDRDFPMTTFDLVSMGVWRHLGPFRSLSSAQRQQIMQALVQVGLVEQAQDLIGSLSGGQLQRALFARLLVRDAQLIILDEPFAAVDEETQEGLIPILQQWHRDGRTLLIVLHDEELVQRIVPETLVIGRGIVAWGPTAETFTTANMRTAQRRCRAIG
ncbi:Manganese import ATP-binding protein ScaC [Oligella urethralis]|uniref:metal ABC transporter ATP-binding protein n=1 Tax=Oligella urethralis TaxID=90245 RepID=UPI0029585DF4|nr:ABC transporter ATP-binding protein [Oligella urethralis]WOS36770.1 Manganese import ATP-binding protein ScaC [Oligella urethralis]